MRKLVVVAVVSLAVAGGVAGTADSAVTWPARCHNFRCVNSHMNQLHSQFVRFKRSTNAFLNCEADLPLSQYGDSAGTFGYEFSNDGVSTIFTTALDVTTSGDDVGAWFIIDTCNTTNPAPRPLLRGLNLRPHSSGLRP
jgi:hypothetical protein